MKWMQSFTTIPLVLFAALLIVGCDAKPRNSEAYDSVETITAGCGGGIAGRIEVVSVHRDGRVDYRLLSNSAGRPGPDSISKATVDDWLESLEAARFFQHISLRSEPYPDQISCSIELVGPHRTHALEVSREPPFDPKILRVFEDVYGLIPRPKS